MPKFREDRELAFLLHEISRQPAKGLSSTLTSETCDSAPPLFENFFGLLSIMKNISLYSALLIEGLE